MKTIPLIRLYKFGWVALVFSFVLQISVRAGADTPAAPSTPVFIAASSLYNGEDIASAPFTASSWGAGTVDAVDYPGLPPGKKALKITTYGPYEGALLTFATPGVLGNIKADKNRFLVIVVLVTPPESASSAGDYPASSLMRLAQYPANQQPGSRSPESLTEPDQAGSSAIQSLHLVLNLTNGASIDTVRDLPVATSSGVWLKVGIPLARLPFSDAQVQGAKLQSLMIAGDRTGTIYVSKMSLISDLTPITAEIEGSREVDQFTTMAYTAHAAGGPSTLSYAWHFSDDGSMPTGRTVTHQFATAGDFKVSVTVLDADLLKPGVMVTTKVHVEAP